MCNTHRKRRLGTARSVHDDEHLDPVFLHFSSPSRIAFRLKGEDMRPRTEPAHGLLVALASHARFAAATTLFSTSVRTTRALNSPRGSLLFPVPCVLRVAPSVLLRAAPHAAPDAATFRIFTSALCRARQPAAAVDLLRCMPELLLDPDPDHCRAVLASLCHCAPARAAAAFIDDMCRWGVLPSRSDHRAVVDSFLRGEKTAEAYDHVVKQMDGDGVAPGLPEFEWMLRAFRARRELDAVENTFEEILLRGLVPGVRVYDVFLGALRDKGDLAGARRMLDCMERAGCPPGVTTFGVVVAGCVAAGDVDAAKEVSREAIRRDAQALFELVDALHVGGHVARAQKLLLEIMRDGCAAGMDVSAFRQQRNGGGGGASIE